MHETDFIDLPSINASKALMTPSEVETHFGQKYYYRMRLHRWAEEGLIRQLLISGKTHYYAGDIVQATEISIKDKLKSVLGKDYNYSIQIDVKNKEILVNGQHPQNNLRWDVHADTHSENEVDLTRKVLVQMGYSKKYW